MKLSILLVIITILFSSCEFNNEQDLYGNTCDTTSIAYSDVKPIFDANCVSCHNQSNTKNGETFGLVVKLHDFDNAKIAAQSGLLFKAVNHLSGVTPMPYKLAKLDSCSINKINAWVHQVTKE